MAPLFALAPAFTSGSLPPDMAGTFHWIRDDDTFTQWRSRSDTCILGVLGGRGLRAVADQICELLGEDNDHGPIVRCDFEDWGQHYRTTKSLLATILTLLVSCYDDSQHIQNFLELHANKGIWHERILYSCWMDALLNIPNLPTTYLFGSLHRCKDPTLRWFVNRLLQMAIKSEKRFKIIMTTDEASDMKGLFSDLPTIHLNRKINADPAVVCTFSPADLQFDLSDEHCRLVRQVSYGCSFDHELCQFVLRWLRTSGSLVSLSEKLACLTSLPALTAHSVVTAILNDVPEELHSVSRRGLAVIAGSFQGFSQIDLASLISDGSGEKTWPYLSMLWTKDDAVRNSQHMIQQAMLQDTEEEQNQWWVFHGHAEMHAEIFCGLLEYLCRDTVQGEMDAFWDNRSSTRLLLNDAYSLLSYAVLHWAQHYRLAGEPSSLRPRALAFFHMADGAVLQRWAKSYHCLRSPETSSEQPLTTPLAISAALGLDDLASNLCEPGNDGGGYQEALSEAVRGKHAETLRSLLAKGTVDKQFQHHKLLRAALEAVPCRDGDCLQEIIAVYSVDEAWQPSRLELQQFLRVACVLGLTDVVQKVMEWDRQISYGEADETWATILTEALISTAAHDELPIANILLDHGAKDRYGAALYTACTWSHVDVARELLKRDDGTNINRIREEEKDETPLQAACRLGKYGAIELLTDVGKDRIDVNLHGFSSPPPLVVCSSNGFSESCQRLVAAGADTNYGNPPGKTPLHVAVTNGNLDICRLLLDNTANADHIEGICLISMAADKPDILEALMHSLTTHGLADQHKDCIAGCLNTAASKGCLETVQCLLRCGADINRKNEKGQAPLYPAAYDSHADVVEYLIDSGADVTVKTNAGWGILHCAYNSADVTEIALSKTNLDVNMPSPSGTALILASRYGCPEVVEVLLRHGADLEATESHSGSHALYYAILGRNLAIVRMLLEAGADINSRNNNNNNTPIQVAVYYAKGTDDEFVQLLLEYHPELNLYDNDGDTALNLVIDKTPVACIRRLINAGADPTILNTRGKSPLSTAIEVHNLPVVEYLVAKYGVKLINLSHGMFQRPLSIACGLAGIDYVKLLVRPGVDVDAIGTGHVETPLQEACLRQSGKGIKGGSNDDNDGDWDRDNAEEEEVSLNIITYLLDNEIVKAKVNCPGAPFGCALNAACLTTSPKTIQILLERGAQASDPMEDARGWQPAHLVCLRTAAHVALFSHEPDLFNKRDGLGRTALHYAVGGGRLDVVKKVLSLSSVGIDDRDVDQWTPLMWAVRGFGGLRIEDPAPEAARDGLVAIVQFLVQECGADIWVRAKSGHRQWSPLKVARYHGASEAILTLLTPPDCDVDGCHARSARGIRQCAMHASQGKESPGTLETWDESFHVSRRASLRPNIGCDACLFVSKASDTRQSPQKHSDTAVYFGCLLRMPRMRSVLPVPEMLCSAGKASPGTYLSGIW